MNAEWHRDNRMPRNATLDQRVAWHIKHAKQCGCRKMPETIRTEIDRRRKASRSQKRSRGGRAI